MIRSPAGFDGGDRIKRYLDYYQPSYGVMMLSAGQFSPALLFAAGEQGAWYDPSDFSTMFQDSTGVTPVTAVEQPVGLILDKSKGLALGSELVTNGDFSSATDWTLGAGWTISGGVATATTTPGTLTQSITITSGRTYAVTFTVANIVGAFRVRLGGATNIVNTTLADGTYTYRAVAEAVDTNLVFAFGTGGSGTIDNISVKEIPGNHARQATSASRPVLSARVNQLLATATLATQSVTTLAATYTFTFSGAGTVTATGTNIGVYSAGSNSLVCTAGTLTLTVVGSVTLADLRVTNDGVGLPAYQAVVTSTNYDTTGFPLYLRFDGTDDSMATAAIDFSATNKMSVFAGVRKLSDAAQGVVAELTATIASNNGSFLLAAPDAASATFAFDSKGTSQVDAVASSQTAPLTAVLTGTADISADACELRVNGASADTDAGDQGSGNYANAILYIGRRGGASLPYNGRISSLIVRGAASTATEISNTETWVNGKTRAY